MKKEFIFDAKVINVVDGDTIDVVIDLGFSMTTQQRLRLYGIDTMETNSKDPLLKENGLSAKKFVSDSVLNQDVTIHTFKPDKYGRYLANVYFKDMFVNEELKRRGLAKEYFGGSKNV
jgi:micrococcal nuclease